MERDPNITRGPSPACLVGDKRCLLYSMLTSGDCNLDSGQSEGKTITIRTRVVFVGDDPPPRSYR
jgi:hypothetical protein